LNDARNFLTGATRFLTDAQVLWDGTDSTDSTSTNRLGVLRWQGRNIQICLYPATLSAQYLESVTQSKEAEDEMRTLRSQLHMSNSGQLIVRVDRIEPTKNIVRGFQAYERLLQMHPELRGRVTFLALLVPSREGLANYHLYERNVRDIITRINTQYCQADWQPIVAVFGNNRVRALAGLQDYDVLLVNPVIDGMNLVVKEGGLLNKRSGVIILSRTVGAHDTIGDHVLSITPLDIDATADALYHALTMSYEERVYRADKVRKLLLQEDATRWFEMQIADLRSNLRPLTNSFAGEK
jgi:trehalose 6-phosphate synthase